MNSIKEGDPKEKKFKEQAKLCQSLTHPYRLKILNFLMDGEKKVSEIQEFAGGKQAYTSQQLKVLKDKGVVDDNRKGNTVYYSLSDPRIIEICKLVAEMAMEKD